MFKLQYQGSMALTAVAVVLLSTHAADAQMVRGGPQLRSGLFNIAAPSSWNERVNQANAERKLPYREDKLRRDVERGDSVAIDRDARRIDYLRYRIVMDQWLIRKIACDEAGCLPYPARLDPMSYCAIAQYHTPPSPPDRR